LVTVEPVSLSAYIYGDKNVTQIVQLNRPAVIRCPAGGFPEPHVSWWRNGHMFGLKNNLMARDYSLVFNSIQLTDLGLYTCEVYNQRRPVSLRVTLKAVGPVRARNHEEAEYLQYVLDPATRPVTQRPVSPYRPTRPAYVPEPIGKYRTFACFGWPGLAKWHFSENEKRCVPFYYTGCGGNKNNFPTLESCEDHCPRQVGKL